MASLKYRKDCKRWQVRFHITCCNGQLVKGSKTFKFKHDAIIYKNLIEQQQHRLKAASSCQALSPPFRAKNRSSVNGLMVSPDFQKNIAEIDNLSVTFTKGIAYPCN